MTTLIAQPTRVRQAGTRQHGAVVAHQRLMILMLLFIMATVAIAVRIGWLSIDTARHRTAQVASGYLPPRADLVDRNGEVLARTIDALSIGVHPSRLLNAPEELAPKLATLMPEHTEAEYLTILKAHVVNRKDGKPVDFIYLRRRALPELVQQINALGEPAMDYIREPQRLYPQTTLAGHVLGFTNFDGLGMAGMEHALEPRLTDPAQREKPVALSIDMRVQAALESELSAGLLKHRARGATGIVLDVQTGEVLAMASLPVFNPNKIPVYKKPAPGEPIDAVWSNSATQNVYELGSTFKPITFANAIDSGVVTSLAKRYDATQPLHVGPFKIHDDEPAHRWLNVPEALVHSSNIVTAQIADQLGKERTAALFQKLNFDKVPAIELHEKGRPIWPKYWARTTVMTIGYGHGMAVTPLHLATAYAALVNGGIWRPSTLMKIDPAQAPKGTRVFSASTSLTLRKLLRLVVVEGTGGKANIEGMRVGGKTGTAEKASNGSYDHHSLVSTFVSAFPMDNPRYVVLTMLDEPHGTADTGGYATAGMVSAPIAGKVIARIGPMLGISPDMHKDIDVSDIQPLLWKPRSERR